MFRRSLNFVNKQLPYDWGSRFAVRGYSEFKVEFIFKFFKNSTFC